MKKLIYRALTLILLSGFWACDTEIINPDLLDGLTPGQMAVVVNGSNKKILNCEYVNNFTPGFKGEVIIRGEVELSAGFEYLSLYYGSNINETPLTAKVYNTNVAADQFSVKSSYGDSSETVNITITFEDVSSASVIGTFEGKLQTSTGLANVRGAFWAVPGQVFNEVKRKLPE